MMENGLTASASPYISHFSSLKKLPEDPILGLSLAFAADSRPHKVNLGVGAYRDAEGKPVVLSCVRKAEEILIEKHLNKEYLPIQGDAHYLKASTTLILGSSLAQRLENQLFSIQTLGGTGALRLGGELLSQDKKRTLYLPDPTWLNHSRVFLFAGMDVSTYPYYQAKSGSLDFVGMCAAISQMSTGSAILLHSACHNPTGIDPTKEQWKELSFLIKKQHLIPFFDVAYAGLGQSLDEDLFAVRYFVEQGHELFIATSYSKIFGLYGERVGMLTAISPQGEIVQAIGSHLKVLARGNYSNPPLHGAQIVAMILRQVSVPFSDLDKKSENLKNEWLQELADIRQRIQQMRQQLVSRLDAEGLPLGNALSRQLGMFAFTGMDQSQLQRLCHEYAIYMADSGRINLAGLNAHNFDYVIHSLLALLKP